MKFLSAGAERHALVALKRLEKVLRLEVGGEVVYFHDVRELVLSEVDVFVFVIVALAHVVVVEPRLLNRLFLFAVLQRQLGGDGAWKRDGSRRYESTDKLEHRDHELNKKQKLMPLTLCNGRPNVQTARSKFLWKRLKPVLFTLFIYFI